MFGSESWSIFNSFSTPKYNQNRAIDISIWTKLISLWLSPSHWKLLPNIQQSRKGVSFFLSFFYGKIDFYVPHSWNSISCMDYSLKIINNCLVELRTNKTNLKGINFLFKQIYSYTPPTHWQQWCLQIVLEVLDATRWCSYRAK